MRLQLASKQASTCLGVRWIPWTSPRFLPLVPDAVPVPVPVPVPVFQFLGGTSILVYYYTHYTAEDGNKETRETRAP